MSSATITGSALAAYAAIVSTSSLLLAVKAYRASGPIVDVSWEYLETGQQLSVSVLNTGRSDVTVTSLELFITHETVTKTPAPVGKNYHAKSTIIAQLRATQWRANYETLSFPVRLASNDTLSVPVEREAIRPLPPQYSLSELALKFVATIPQGDRVAYFRGDVLRHFVASDPEIPVTPGQGAVPRW